MFPRLETERLILRSFRAEDLPAFAAYRSYPKVAEYQSWEVPYTQAQAVAFLAVLRRMPPATPGAWYQVALALKETGELIGDCAFCVLADDARQTEIGFTLAAAFHGQGYATEAGTRLLAYLFEELDLQRVRANCDVENRASARLLARLGMRRDGDTVTGVWFKGRWSSEDWYAILREEWKSQTPDR